MRLFATLAVVVVALLVAMVRQAISMRDRSAPAAAPPPPPEVEVAVAVADNASPPPRAPRLSYVAPASGETSVRAGVAHLHGRVLPAPGRGADTLEGLSTVVFDDGVRSFEVETTDEGRFSIRLPPGRYELSASSGEWSGSVSDVVARAGTERAIDIQLQQGAAISGVLRGKLPRDVDVMARFAGRRSTEAVDGEVSDHGFELAGLLPGHRYDLEIRSNGARTVYLRDVIAPARHLDIELVALPVLRGAFGSIPGGGDCPIDTVKVTLSEPSHKDDDAAADWDWDDGDNVTSDCRFELTLPVAGASAHIATVTATGAGWHVEQLITIPARGDPDPLCLNPPCRADQLD